LSNRLRSVLSVFRSAFVNPTLRRVGSAYALFGSAEFGIWLVLLVFAYERGGPSASVVMVMVQLVPCVVLGPFIGSLADRRRPSAVLRSAYALQAATMAGVALAVGLRAPDAVVYLLAALASLSLTATRPAQAALLPAIVRTPDELTAANVTTGWTEGAASLVGPAVAGMVLALSGPAAAVGAMAVMSVLSLLLVATVAGPAAAIPATTSGSIPGDRSGPPPDGVATGHRESTSVVTGVRANLTTALSHPQLRVLLALHAFYFILIGSLDLLCVILALTILHLGAGGAGYLNAALGAGALLAGFVTAFLVGRRHLSRTLSVSLAISVGALAIIAAVPRVAPAFLLIGTVGLAGTVFDITGRTLLQRAAPPDAIAGSFSILEATTDFGLATGAVLVRVATGVGGVRAALVAPAMVATLLIAVLWRQLARIDATATVPQVEIQLLRSLPIFAALSPPSLEGVARELEPVPVPAGTVVVAQGEPGNSYYAVADGQLTVTRDGQLVGTLGRGDGFGEIALVREVPRQATVTAIGECLLFSLDKDPFIQALSGHASAASAVSAVVARHLGHDRPVPGVGTDPHGPDG
jgi:predicted MFS family arabinose efflux permease